MRAAQLRDTAYGFLEQLVKVGITQEELTKALAYFNKSYLEDGDKADKWADKIANEVANGTSLLNAGNYNVCAKQVNVSSLNAYIKAMDSKKNVVKLIFR